VWDETLTIEYAGDTLAQYRIAFEADGHRLREVGEPRLYATAHASPQPFLSPLDEVAWHPAQRLAPYRPRRKRDDAAQQERLFDQEGEASVG
jgi:hypothetical protein